MSGDKVKKRLMELMGSDEVYINDRNFMLLLEQKIADEYQKQECLKLKLLQDQEKKRERKLVLEGIIERKSEDNSNAKQKQQLENEENTFFDDTSMGFWPNYSRAFTEKMRRDIDEEGEASDECEPKEAEEAEDANEKDAEAEDGAEAEAEAEGTAAEDENAESAPQEENAEADNEDEAEAKESDYHSCSYINRPFSARVQQLIEEESFEGMLEIAEQLISPAATQK